MDNIRIYSFENFRLGDKIAACYQLQYYAINKGYHYILVDPTADSYFSIRRYFPSIGQYCIETNTAHEIYEELKSIIKRLDSIIYGYQVQVYLRILDLYLI